MTRAVRPRTLRRIASRARQRGYLGLNSYRRLAASALSGPSFAAGLLTSIVPDKAAPSTTPTFTRATTKTFVDWEGRVRTALAGEACFTGARRVANLFTGSAALATQSVTTIAGTYTISFTGTGTITFTGAFTGSLVGQGAGTRVSTTIATTAGTLTCTVSGSVINAQCENVTGQSNTNPGEYTDSATSYGAGVNAVQYFATQNGNTVTSNVVTAGTGAAIPSSVLLGYSAWQQSTNLVLQSENFGTTWTLLNTPTRVAGALRCGDVLLDQLSDADATLADGYRQVITFTGDATKAISFHFAQGTSASSAIRVRDSTAAADRLIAVITWTGGVPTITMTTGTLLGVDALGNGVYRGRVLTAAVTAANVNNLDFFPASDAAIAIANTGNAYFGGVQAENLVFVTPYIATTTATVTRNADVLTHAAAGNIVASAGTMYAEVQDAQAPTAAAVILACDDGSNASNSIVAVHNSSGTLRQQQIAATVLALDDQSVASLALNAANKVAVKFSTTDTGQFLNGSKSGSTTNPTATPSGLTTIRIAARSDGFQINGNIRNVKIWTRALADAELVQATL